MNISRATPPAPLPADLRKALDSFQGEAAKIVKSFLDGLQSQPLPPIVYHYTNKAGEIFSEGFALRRAIGSHGCQDAASV